MVKHRSRYICESAIYFDIDKEIIKQNCLFKFYYNKTDVTPTVLNRGNEINLANWPDDKDIICTINYDIPIKILSHPYVLVNRSVLCNCDIEAENNFLLESLAAYHDDDTNLVMCFMVNTAFVNYIDQINLTEKLTFPVLTNKTTLEHTLPIFLNDTRFDETLTSAPQTLKEYISQYKQKKEIFDLKERHNIDIDSPNKNFFTNILIVDIFIFTIAIILAITTLIILYLLCKHNKLRTLVASLTLQQVKEVSASATKQDTNNACNCTSKFYIILALSISIIRLVIFAILQDRRTKVCRGQLFSNAVKIMPFISDIQYYVPIKLCKTTSSIHLFKITGILTPDKVKLKKHYIWDIIEVDWKEVKEKFNGKAFNVPKSITIKF